MCGLICMEHEVPCWSETAVEGSSCNSYPKHPLAPPVNSSVPGKFNEWKPDIALLA